MRELPVFLALFAGLGGASSTVLAVIGPRSAISSFIVFAAMIITFGALSAATRLTRQNHAA